MKKRSILTFIILLNLVMACTKTTIRPTNNELSGRWTEHLPDGIGFFSATLHSFYFTKDSFTAKIISWTDVIVTLPGDPCPSNGVEEIFIRGTYSLKNDSIYFNGKLCDSLYQNFQPTCYGMIDYKYKFRFTKNDTAIILNEDQEWLFGYGIVLKKE